MEKELNAADIRRQTGLSRASVARLASNNEIPGAYRHDGLHFLFPSTPELSAWIDTRRAKRARAPKAGTRFDQGGVNANDKSTGLVTIEGISMKFELWLRKVKAAGHPDKWGVGRLQRVADLLKPMMQELKNCEDRLRRLR